MRPTITIDICPGGASAADDSSSPTTSESAISGAPPASADDSHAPLGPSAATKRVSAVGKPVSSPTK